MADDFVNVNPPGQQPEESIPDDLYAAADEPLYPGPPAEPETGLQSEEHLEAPYQHYKFVNKWVYHSGKEQIPIAALTGSARNVRLHAPCQQRICTWEVKRRGLPPNMPAPTPRNDNEELIYAEVEASATKPAGDDVKTPEYSVHGVYIFALAEPVWGPDSLSLPIGAEPWTTLVVEDQVIDGGYFVEGMI